MIVVSFPAITRAALRHASTALRGVLRRCVMHRVRPPWKTPHDHEKSQVICALRNGFFFHDYSMNIMARSPAAKAPTAALGVVAAPGNCTGEVALGEV